MNDISIFDQALGFTKSQRYEYNPENNNTTGVTYHYVDLGNNVELDTIGYLYTQHYIFCSAHVRNFDEFKSDSIINVLKQIRRYIIDKTSDATYSKEYNEVIQSFPDEETIKVNIITFDPGFTGHSDNEEKVGGVKLGHMAYLAEDPTHAAEYRRIDQALQVIHLKKLILDPESIYQDFVLQHTDYLNKILFTLKNQLHIKKKQYMQLKKLLSGSQTLKVYASPTSADKIDIPFEYFGHSPHIEIDVDKYGHVQTQLSPNVAFGEFGFNVYVPTDTYERITKTNDSYDEFKNMVQDLISEKLTAIGIKMYWTSYMKLNIIEK